MLRYILLLSGGNNEMLSETLRHAVKLHHLRGYQLAHAIGVHPSRLSKWLSGAEPPPLGDKRIIQLGQLVGVPADRCFAPVDSRLSTGIDEEADAYVGASASQEEMRR